MTRVRWDEPSEAGDVCRTATIEEAVTMQQDAARKRSYFYDDNLNALGDFLVIHWAWIEGALL